MKWGMSGFEDSQQDRPLFLGVDVRSPIDGSKMRYFPAKTYEFRINVVNIIIFLSLVIVILIVAAIFILDSWINDEKNKEMFTIGSVFIGANIISVIMGMMINILNMVYSEIAFKLNAWENHRTDTIFEDKLITKIFLFQLVNNFAFVTYIAFIKNIISQCLDNNCIKEVADNVSIIFITALAVRLITQVIVSIYLQHLKILEDTEGIEPGVERSPLEEQYSLQGYDAVLITLQDYAALVIQFGFTVLFVVAYPLGPTIACISAYIQIRVDGWKLCQAYQRPEPKSVEDIGVWQDMITLLSYLAVVYNLGLLFFTDGRLTKDMTPEMKWILFVILQNLLLIGKYSISRLVEDQPLEVSMQLQRQDFLVSKVIYDMKDDSDDVSSNKVKKPTNIIIHQTDSDWILPENKK